MLIKKNVMIREGGGGLRGAEGGIFACYLLGQGRTLELMIIVKRLDCCAQGHGHTHIGCFKTSLNA